MKIFTNTKFLKKIAIFLIIITLCSFVMPVNNVNAARAAEDKEGKKGGKMLQPIVDLLMYIGDAILNILQNNFLSIDDILIPANSPEYNKGWNWLAFAGIVIGVIVVVVGICVLAPVFAGGTFAAAIAGGATKLIAGATVVKVFAVGAVAVGGGTFLGITSTVKLHDDLKGAFDIPIIQYTPYTIFSGQIPTLDINFIDPMENKYVTITEEKSNLEGNLVSNYEFNEEDLNELGYSDPNNDRYYFRFIYSASDTWTITMSEEDSERREILDEAANVYTTITCVGNDLVTYSDQSGRIDKNKESLDYLYGKGLVIKYPGYENYMNYELYEWTNNEDGQRYTYVDFGADMVWVRLAKTETEGIVDGGIKTETVEKIVKEYKSSSGILQSSIATWYKVLRTVALVGLLSVLVYVGIRILLTSVAADKAKYKKMLIDWVVAICILFILHYLMVFILNISSKLTEILILDNNETSIPVTLPPNTKIDGHDEYLVNEVEAKAEEYKSTYGSKIDTSLMIEDGKPVWVGDYVGYIRLKAGVEDNGTALTYGIMYLVLVIYTCMFTFMYLKRVLYMAFLTMIAPLIALTYPLDKIKDGKAQAFSLWIREYIFNALIQPVHLILYTMIMSTVLNLAVEHPVYALVALGFFTPAERFIRKMFGFDSAGTVSALGQVAGGAAVMGAVNKLSKLNKRKKKDEEDEGKDKVRTKEEGGYGLPFAPSGQGENDDGGNGPIPTPRQSSSPTNSSEDNSGAENEQSTLSASERYARMKQDAANSYAEKYGGRYENQDGATAKKKEEVVEAAEKKNKNGILTGMKKVGNHYRKKILKAKPLRAAGRWTGRILGGAALGTVGLAAGIATGDPSKALSYTAAGAGVGGALGGTIAENTMDEAKEIRENFSKGYQGEAAYTNKKLDEEYYNGTGKGESFQDILEQEDLRSDLKGRERANALREEVQGYRKSGITDNTQISTCMRAGLTPEEGVYAVQISKAMEKGGWNKQKVKNEYEVNCRQLLRDQGISEDKIDQIWNTVPKLLF